MQKVSVRYVGNFDWNQSAGQVKKKGFCFEIEWPDHKQKAYVTPDGELLKVDLPSGRYLLYEIVK